MIETSPVFRTRLAASLQDVAAAQRLRYDVFVHELGAGGGLVDHTARREADHYDTFADHLLLEDTAQPGAPVVGAYRLMSAEQAARAGGFSAAAEFDLSPLPATGRPVLELGRSCLLPAYRGGPAMMHLFAALARIAADRGEAILFGVASFHGTNAGALSAPLAYLRQHHLAPAHLRTRAHGPGAAVMPSQSPADRKAALRAIPPLIKAYLRLGGVVGEGACVDDAFNTVDVCMILDPALMTDAQRARALPERIR
ncbi:GNAT family N-acetyltransferase [Loktanella sp. R86503]|uniref:GNAT family N-acetyltransferase n=1 Tax=Loktanella sp. R86503 TaxID=3093847 RepID=UPI0036DEC8CE